MERPVTMEGKTWSTKTMTTIKLQQLQLQYWPTDQLFVFHNFFIWSIVKSRHLSGLIHDDQLKTQSNDQS